MPSTVDLRARYKLHVDKALNNKHQKSATSRTTGNFAAHARGMQQIDGERLRGQVRQMKEYVLRHLPELLERLEERLIANGGHVHWARDAAEASQIIQQIAREKRVQLAVKSKSMTSEEIHLNRALEEIGVRTIETDLGEYIVQLANEPPSHIIAPLSHRRIEDISEIFQRELDLPPTFDPTVMCSAARYALRNEFLSADMGISGCNFAVAESGHICIVTNEGNGRLVSTLPRIYVALLGIEKIVPTLEDALLQYQLLCRSATGQNASAYLSMTSGPRKAEDADGPEEFHVVLLDNGRSHMLASGYGEALLCLRCGACLNVCPVYREIGGHAYGSTYSGPIGAVINPLLATLVTDVEQLPHASTLCGACRDVCPVKIDLPRLLLDLRADTVHRKQAPFFERKAIQSFVRATSSRGRYERAGTMARLATGLMAALSGGNLTFAPPPLAAWTESRSLPAFAPKSFRELWRERTERRKEVVRESQGGSRSGYQDRPVNQLSEGTAVASSHPSDHEVGSPKEIGDPPAAPTSAPVSEPIEPRIEPFEAEAANADAESVQDVWGESWDADWLRDDGNDDGLEDSNERS